VRLSLPPRMVDDDDDDDDDCRAIGGMNMAGETESTRRKLTPVPLCPPQITHNLKARTRAAPVGS
jgi:hypothetical protein